MRKNGCPPVISMPSREQQKMTNAGRAFIRVQSYIVAVAQPLDRPVYIGREMTPEEISVVVDRAREDTGEDQCRRSGERRLDMPRMPRGLLVCWSHIVSCGYNGNGCKQSEVLDEQDSSDAYAQAIDKGWKWFNNYGWLCPNCVRSMQLRPPGLRAG